MLRGTRLRIFVILIGYQLLGGMLGATEVVALKSANLRAGPGTQHGIVGKATLGQRFTVLETREGWYRLQHDGETAWITASLAAADDDPSYHDAVLILYDAPLMYPSDSEKRSAAQAGEIATLVSADITKYRVRFADGTTGSVRDEFVMRIGPHKPAGGLMGLMIAESGPFQKALKALKTYGERNTTTRVITIIIAIVLFLLPLFLAGYLINLIEDIRFLPNFLVKFVMLMIMLTFIGVFTNAYIISPLYPVGVGMGFGLLGFLMIFAELREIRYNRCPKCHHMLETEDKGTRLAGITVWKSRSSGKKVGADYHYENIRRCQNCGHVWKIHRTDRDKAAPGG